MDINSGNLQIIKGLDIFIVDDHFYVDDLYKVEDNI